MKISTAALCTLAVLTAQEVVRNVTIASAHDGQRSPVSEAHPAAKTKLMVASAAPVAIAHPEVLPVTKPTSAPSPIAAPTIEPPAKPAATQPSSPALATPTQVQAYHPAAGPRLVVRRRLRNLTSPQVIIAQAPRQSLPVAQRVSSTPISDRFGVRGTEPNAEAWRSAIKQRYGIPTVPTPITDRFGARGTEPNAEAWRAAIKQRYGIRSIPTPITDRFGARGTEPNAEAWRAAIKQRYGIRVR